MKVKIVLRSALLALAGGMVAAGAGAKEAAKLPYPIVDTGQTQCYSDRAVMATPKPGQAFYGQDAQFQHHPPAYKNNGDGTVSDLVTGLIWVQARGEKVTWNDAVAQARQCKVGGYDDWRMPTIKELYSLINFNGGARFNAANSKPYLDTKYFGFVYGDTAQGVRMIDCQDWSATQYTGKTMNGNPTVFGVNFADGRIKGYPKVFPGGRSGKMYIRFVRGNPAYGKNDFKDNADGTISDKATGLMWSLADSGRGMDWPSALAWVQSKNAARFLGHNDWRLPNAKELQSIVDYTRSPSATQSAALDPIFRISPLADGDFPFFWSSTSHLEGPPDRQGGAAVYVAFGRATGWMKFPPTFSPQLLDVHGAGAQRSDPKVGDPADFPYGRGPQGDVIRINNFVRLVRDAGQ